MGKQQPTKAERVQRDNLIVTMLKQGHSLDAIADTTSMLKHNLKRTIKRIESEGMLQDVPEYSADVKRIDAELERLEAEIEMHAENLANPNLSQTQVNNLAKNLRNCRLQKRQFIQEKNKLVYTPVPLPEQEITETGKTQEQERDDFYYSELLKGCEREEHRSTLKLLRKHKGQMASMYKWQKETGIPYGESHDTLARNAKQAAIEYQQELREAKKHSKLK
jgi:archaellum component FlaC